MVVACLALLVALGGTGVAAVSQLVPRNSVVTLQLQRNAVTPAKIAPSAVRGAHVQNGSLLTADFTEGQIPAGPAGAAGPAGPAGPFPDSLPSRRTIRGAYSIRATAVVATSVASTGVSFVYALAAAPTAHVIRQGAAAPAQCPGSATFPQADAGHLCIYESAQFNTPEGTLFTVNRSGARSPPCRTRPVSSTASERGRSPEPDPPENLGSAWSSAS